MDRSLLANFVGSGDGLASVRSCSRDSEEASSINDGVSSADTLSDLSNSDLEAIEVWDTPAPVRVGDRSPRGLQVVDISAWQRLNGMRLDEDGRSSPSATLSSSTTTADEQMTRASTALPEQALRKLQSSLAGPSGSGAVPSFKWIRLWVASAANINGMMVGYAAMCSFKTLHSSAWDAMAWLSFFVWSIIGLLVGEATVVMALAVVDVLQTNTAGVGDGNTNGRSSGGHRHHFMRRFLQAKVTPEAAADVERAVTFARKQVVCYTLMQGFVYIGLLVPRLRNPEYLDASLEDGSLFAVCFGILCCVPFAMVVSGWLLFISVPSRVVGDRIQRHILRVKYLTTLPAEQIGVAAVTMAVQRTHQDCLRLAALLHPPLKVAVFAAAISVGYYLCMSVCPRDDVDTAGLAYRGFTRLFTAPVFFCMAIAMTPAGIWPMRAPAEVNETTDRLISAIVELQRHLARSATENNENSASRQSKSDSSNGMDTRIAQQVSTIDAVLVEARHLNGGAGLGFMIWGACIRPSQVHTVTFASVCIVAAIAAMLSHLL